MQCVPVSQNDYGDSSPITVLVLLLDLDALTQCKGGCGFRGLSLSRLPVFRAVDAVEANFYRIVQNQRVSINNSRHRRGHQRLR